MKRAWIMAVGFVVMLVLVALVTILALLRPPREYPFVAGEHLERKQEYIEDFPMSSRLSREAVYKSDDPIEQVLPRAQQSLKEWNQFPAGVANQVQFRHERDVVTLQRRQKGGGTTIFIQEFHTPTFSDRARMWWHKHVG